mgnify:CR=1 FL=1|tara:strand:- start:40 stop:1866 length:1827 start_codon:yes stop_codon:yes gene_type:complete
MNKEDEKKVKQNLMFDLTGYPEEKFTENGERYYYTRPDGTPITGSNWSLKDLAYPLNLFFGGKSPTDDSWGLEEGSQEQLNAELSKHSFGSWLVNAAPTQLLPFLGAAKKFRQVRSNKKVMKGMKYQEKVEDVTGFGDKPIAETIIDDVFNLNTTDTINLSKLNNIKNKGLIKDFTSGSLKKGGLFDPNRSSTIMYSSTPKKSKLPPKITTNEKIKESLLNDEAVILPATYQGGPKEIRKEADFFDVSAALIGPGQEGKTDSKGRKIPYDRKGVTEFGSTKSAQRDKVYKHLQAKLGINNITRTEFNKYAAEQIKAEKDLRKAIKLLNLRAYAAAKNIDLSNYPTKESQLEFLNKINKAKRNKTGYTDYKETFDYGHIISAKTGFRLEDLGMNRISNTEIESAHNVVSRDPYTQKIIEILQEGNRERGSRRDFIPIVQMMRNTAGTVAEDFIKWRSNQRGEKVGDGNLTKILDKFIPREYHENYLKFVQRRFYEKRKLSGSLRQFMEYELGIPYERFKKLGTKLQLQIRRMYEKDVAESGNVIGRQQYDQAEQWMREAIDEFIGLHHSDKFKRVRGIQDSKDLKEIDDLLPRDINTLLDMILPDSIDD